MAALLCPDRSTFVTGWLLCCQDSLDINNWVDNVNWPPRVSKAVVLSNSPLSGPFTQALCSIGVKLKMSAFKTLYGGQFTLSTQLRRPNFYKISRLLSTSFFQKLISFIQLLCSQVMWQSVVHVQGWHSSYLLAEDFVQITSTDLAESEFCKQRYLLSNAQ